jgi:hypothetical protein
MQQGETIRESLCLRLRGQTHPQARDVILQKLVLHNWVLLLHLSCGLLADLNVLLF